MTLHFSKHAEIPFFTFLLVIILPILASFGCGAKQTHRAAALSSLETPRPEKPVPVTQAVPINTLQNRGPVYAAALSTSGEILALAGRGEIAIWDVYQKKALRHLTGQAGDITALAFSPDGSILAAGGNQSVMLWRVTTGQSLGMLPRQAAYVTALAFSPDGRQLVSGTAGAQSSLTIWNVTEKRVESVFSYDTKYADLIQSIVFSPDGERLAAAGLDHRIRVWAMTRPINPAPVQTLFSPGMTTRAIAFSPRHNTLAAGMVEGGILLFDLSTGGVLKQFQRHQGGVGALAFSTDGDTLVSSGKDHVLRHWDMRTGVEIKREHFSVQAQTILLSKDTNLAAVIGPIETRVFFLKEDRGVPPAIHIRSPKAGETAHQPMIRLTGKVTDDQGLAKVSIQLNNVIWESGRAGNTRDLVIVEKSGKTREMIIDETLPLREGENLITLTALDVEGLIHSETLQIQYAPNRGTVWAAVIGISRYQHVSGLRYADADARAFYDYLVNENRVPENQVTLLLNEEATLQRLRDLLGVELREKARKQDTVIIYYAGHGAPEPDRGSPDGDGLEKYLLPYDADPNRLYSTAFPMTEMARIFPRLSAERVVMLQDTCFSGATGLNGRTIETALFRASISDTFLNRLTQGKGRVIITASEANEVSVERDDLGHGVFTHYLLEAFRHGDIDGDGLITTHEAFRYVSEKVPAATRQNQHPVKKGIESSDIVLGRVSGGE